MDMAEWLYDYELDRMWVYLCLYVHSVSLEYM